MMMESGWNDHDWEKVVMGGVLWCVWWWTAPSAEKNYRTIQVDRYRTTYLVRYEVRGTYDTIHAHDVVRPSNYGYGDHSFATADK